MGNFNSLSPADFFAGSAVNFLLRIDDEGIHTWIGML
jgi:hypothetical protein